MNGFITVQAEISEISAVYQISEECLMSEIKRRYKAVSKVPELGIIREVLGLNHLSSKDDIIQKITEL